MSKKQVLITGGAGFIGSHLADDLIAHGHEVRILDSLAARVHPGRERPDYLNTGAELIVGDVRDGVVVERALKGVDVVIHLAAAVGVGESMYEVEQCTSVNNVGTAVLMDRVVRAPVERILLASSMCVYGEGLYRDGAGRPAEVMRRSLAQLRRGQWEPAGAELLTPAPTPEAKTVSPGSVYARSKHDQERMCLRMGRLFGVPTMALRLFNVFGERQSSSNPYSGDLSLFATRLLAGRRPLVPEDGQQRRDFVDVRDVACAFRLALEAESLPGPVLNVGSGQARTVADFARKMADVLGRVDLVPEVTGKYQIGDARHCFPDVTRVRRTSWRPSLDLETSLWEFVRWIGRQMRPTRERSSSLRLETEAMR
jgi:dTDP-L-rhamnose 4-epimerase